MLHANSRSSEYNILNDLAKEMLCLFLIKFLRLKKKLKQKENR